MYSKLKILLTDVCVYIYIYIERERERERECNVINLYSDWL